MNKVAARRSTGLAAAAVLLGLIAPAAPALAADAERESSAQAVFTKLPTNNYRLSARFNQRGPYWSSGRHTGLDFSAPRGTKVKAVGAGRVVFAGYAGAYGKAVIVKHPSGKRSLYAHLHRIVTKKGRTVVAGDRLGRVGSTGNTTGPHLHFEVRSTRGKHLDPRPYLRGE